MPTIQRLTEDNLKEQIIDVQYQRFGETCTVCALILKNGFVLIGKSACILPEMYDEEIGKQIAYEDAFKQMWQLEGYHVKSTNYAALMASGG